MQKLTVLLIALLFTDFTQAQQPNIVVILTDDQGWGDLSLHGNKNLSTPHLDALARSGAQFDRFYVCAVCSPTRATVMTGRYPIHNTIDDYIHVQAAYGLPLNETTLPQLLKGKNYSCHAIGKW